MAKTHQSFSPFLVGFLLVLFVSDLAYVHGKSCYLLGVADLGVDPDMGDIAYIFCDAECKKIDENYEYFEKLINAETGQRFCQCCLWR
ncbi:hypothetical protein MKW94_019326 [Papaver nudicaule]|uniref:Uncharacterized protein n=1 Tax=Papaver nudicaule TaxID=74823 RepID=A0AA41VS75_PAPNU|nr:hypothetical protein [Papaver nudicaule]